MKRSAGIPFYCILLFVIGCTDVVPNISYLRSLKMPTTTSLMEKFYTNDTNHSPGIHISPYATRYESQLDHFEYLVSKDGAHQTEWISLGKSFDFTVPYTYTSEGEYQVFIRAITIGGAITDFDAISFFVDTNRPAINIITTPGGDITKMGQMKLDCYNCDDLTTIEVELQHNNTGTTLGKKTFKIYETTDFSNLPPSHYVYIIKYIDRAGNTADTIVGWANCDDITITCEY